MSLLHLSEKELRRGEATWYCCGDSDSDSDGSFLSSVVERSCSLFFVTTKPFHHAGILVRDHVGKVSPTWLVGPYLMREYDNRTESGFYVCEVKFELPHGEEFESKDWLRLETFRTLDGEDMFFEDVSGEMFPEGGIVLLDRDIVCKLSVQCSALYLAEHGEVGIGSDDELCQSEVDLIEGLLESISNVVGSTSKQYDVDDGTCLTG